MLKENKERYMGGFGMKKTERRNDVIIIFKNVLLS